MPIDYKRYPPNWPEVRRAILERDGHRCKFCGVPNGAVGARDRNGDWRSIAEIDNLNSDVGLDLFGGVYPRTVRIVLTVAHLVDPNPLACDHLNLAALCQKCHLRHDGKLHARRAAETRRRKKQATGQLALDACRTLDQGKEAVGA